MGREFPPVDGALMHENAHDADFRESRGDLLVTRGVSVFSSTLGVSGQCDVLEYHRGIAGIPIRDKEGIWQPYPVEYKRGRPREDTGDTLQLCGQAMCLEKMLCCGIPGGALYYGEIRRRVPVVKPSKSCNACSIKELCLLDAAQCRKLQAKLCSIMDAEKDSLRFYYLGNQYGKKIEHFGCKNTDMPEDTLIL